MRRDLITVITKYSIFCDETFKNIALKFSICYKLNLKRYQNIETNLILRVININNNFNVNRN